MIETMTWDGAVLRLIDQRKLPFEKEYFECRTLGDVEYGIKSMVVRGAPAIGVTAIFGMVLALREGLELDYAAKRLSATRPTAVNLFWGLERAKDFYLRNSLEELEKYAVKMYHDDIDINRRIGSFGSSLISNDCNILTHCNAGALATAGYGTALGVMRGAKEQGLKFHVYVDETRPYLQGSRLTAFELMEEGIDCTLICDNMAGYLMKNGKIDLVVTGADRIALNGDTANKIGTYSVAVLAKYHGIPFYIAAPMSTFDTEIVCGDDIKVEIRDELEVKQFFGVNSAPLDVRAFNPSFDVTPSGLIRGFITEFGVIKGNFSDNILKFKKEADYAS